MLVFSLIVQKLQAFSLPEPPTKQNTFVSTIYRATYLYQYSESRGLIFVFVYSNRDHEFKYYNTIALYIVVFFLYRVEAIAVLPLSLVVTTWS